MTTQHSRASPASLNFIPTCVSVSKSGRQEGWAAAHRQRAGVTGLSTAEQQLQKKSKRKKRGRQLGHGSPPRVQETAHSSGTRPKEAGIGLLLEKLTSEQGSREGTERKRGGCLTWSVKASCSFLAAAPFHFYLLDTPRLKAELNRSPGGKSWTKERNNKQKGGERKHGKFAFTALLGLLIDCGCRCGFGGWGGGLSFDCCKLPALKNETKLKLQLVLFTLLVSPGGRWKKTAFFSSTWCSLAWVKKAKHYNCFTNAEPLRLTRFNSVICCEQKSWKKLFFPPHF